MNKALACTWLTWFIYHWHLILYCCVWFPDKISIFLEPTKAKPRVLNEEFAVWGLNLESPT